MNSMVDRYLNDPSERCLFEQELAIVAATEAIHRWMEMAQTNQASLAEKLGVSASCISQMLDGDNNFTVRKLSEIMFHLGQRISFEVSALDERVSCDIETEYEIPAESRTFSTTQDNVPEYFVVNKFSPQMAA